jgi:peptide deformylase
VIRQILKMGDPRLLRTARRVEDIHNPALRAIIADMYETMHAANGVGLAAPQIGVDLRLMIFGFNANPRYPSEPPVPVTTLIKSLARIADGRGRGWLGRLSTRSRHARAGAACDAHSLWRHARGWQPDRA